MLSSAAAAAAAQPSDSPPVLQQLHVQLQQLTVELAHVLVEQLLHACSPGADHNSRSSGDGGERELQDSSSLLTDAGLGYVLTHSLLPRLQALRTAAPQSMLMCLTTLGELPCKSCNVLLCMHCKRVGGTDHHDPCIGWLWCSSSSTLCSFGAFAEPG